MTSTAPARWASIWLGLLLVLSSGARAPAQVMVLDDLVFREDFESGVVCPWSLARPLPSEICDGLDNDCDGVVDDGILCIPPTLSAVDYDVIAHGARLVVMGTNLATASHASLGGVVHPLADVSDGSVTIDPVLDTVPVGAAQVTVTGDGGVSNPLDVTAVRLVLSEVEPDSPGADVHEFIEVSTGVAQPLDLDGYVVVLFNGFDSSTLGVFDLGAATPAASGLVVIGPTTLPVAPNLATTTSFLQSGEDAVAIYQYAPDPGLFPADYPTAGNEGLLDALIYESGSDADALALYSMIEAAPYVVQTGTTSSARETTSAQRCDLASARRITAGFAREVPTPGMTNVGCGAVAPLPECTITFDGGCPTSPPGECGAYFLAHDSALCESVGVAACHPSPPALHSTSADNRIDVFLLGGLTELETFLTPYLGVEATMRFYDLDGNEVGVVVVDTDCGTETPPSIVAPALSGTARRIRIEGDADILVDDFHVNPP